MNKKIFLFGFALFLLFIGGMIYLCFRQPTILLFKWLDLIGFNYTIFQNINIIPPKFIVYNLPNVLFILFSYIIIYIIWDNKKYYYLFYVSLITILAIIYEIVTYDINDIIAIFVTYFICIFLYLKYSGVRYEK